jgi:hypothetical protein
MNFTFDATTILFIILIVVILVLAWMVFYLNSKLNKFLIGSKTENLNDSLSTIDSSIRGLESFKTEIENYLTTVEARLKKSTQGIHTVRFNPFAGSTGSGGNQSFATAFINEQGDGVVISSLYARDHVSVFAKPVTKGKSEYELSDEEAKAIKEAISMVK